MTEEHSQVWAVLRMVVPNVEDSCIAGGEVTVCLRAVGPTQLQNNCGAVSPALLGYILCFQIMEIT